MNKNLLSSIVTLSFLGYSLYVRVYGANPASQLSYTVSQPSPILTTTPTPTDTPIPTDLPINQPTSLPTPTETPTPTPRLSSGYKDGTYTGQAADAYYGLIQVQATISNSKITNVQFLQYPNDRDTSIAINHQADPILAQEAIQVQSAQVDIVSGATDSSQAFSQSLQSALNEAKG